MLNQEPEWRALQAKAMALTNEIRDRLISVYAKLASQIGRERLSTALQGGVGIKLVVAAINQEFKIFIPEEQRGVFKNLDLVVRLIFKQLQRGGSKSENNGTLFLPAPISEVSPSSVVKELTNACGVLEGSLIGLYRADRFIGRGAFGSVFVGQHSTNGSRVAIKVPSTSGGGRIITRLQRVSGSRTPNGISPDEIPAEAIVFEKNRVAIDTLPGDLCRQLLVAQAQRLKECTGIRGVVPYINTIDVNGAPAMITEFIGLSTGINTLRDVLRRSAPIWLGSFVNIAETCLRMGGHGDLKPENILLSSLGGRRQGLILIDPAVTLTNGQRSVSTMTPQYNPFLLRGERADVHALGIVLYEILTGTLPFNSSPWEFAGQNRTDEVANLSHSMFLCYPKLTDLPKTPRKSQARLHRIVDNCLLYPTYDLRSFAIDLKELIQSSC